MLGPAEVGLEQPFVRGAQSFCGTISNAGSSVTHGGGLVRFDLVCPEDAHGGHLYVVLPGTNQTLSLLWVAVLARGGPGNVYEQVSTKTKCAHTPDEDDSARPACSKPGDSSRHGNCGDISLAACVQECRGAAGCTHFSHQDPAKTATCVLCKGVPGDPWLHNNATSFKLDLDGVPLPLAHVPSTTTSYFASNAQRSDPILLTAGLPYEVTFRVDEPAKPSKLTTRARRGDGHTDGGVDGLLGAGHARDEFQVAIRMHNNRSVFNHGGGASKGQHHAVPQRFTLSTKLADPRGDVHELYLTGVTAATVATLKVFDAAAAHAGTGGVFSPCPRWSVCGRQLVRLADEPDATNRADDPWYKTVRDLYGCEGCWLGDVTEVLTSPDVVLTVEHNFTEGWFRLTLAFGGYAPRAIPKVQVHEMRSLERVQDTDSCSKAEPFVATMYGTGMTRTIEGVAGYRHTGAAPSGGPHQAGGAGGGLVVFAVYVAMKKER